MEAYVSVCFSISLMLELMLDLILELMSLCFFYFPYVEHRKTAVAVTSMVV